jgi:hypothetical protein
MTTFGGQKNIVVKTSGTFDEIKSVFTLSAMRRVLWQPHPGQSNTVQETVQYIHDWLVNVPKSINAWEMNIYFEDDEPNKLFCVTDYIGPSQSGSEYPYGRIDTRYVSSMQDTSGCAYGPYQNMLDYLRVNTGNPQYFGFTQEQKDANNLISGNRANLWLLTTAAPVGTSDRYYRWQMLGSDPTYNMSDPVRYFSYPYVMYQILNGDRMEAVRQALELELFPNWGGPTAGHASEN